MYYIYLSFTVGVLATFVDLFVFALSAIFTTFAQNTRVTEALFVIFGAVEKGASVIHKYER